MVNCPECGAKMKYIRGRRIYVCESCGYEASLDEILRIREQRKRKKVNTKSEYLSWWLKKKEKK